MIDSSLVNYTGLPLTYIPVSPNTDLQTILGLINTAINTSSAAPNYSGYSLSCVTQTDGTSHPTNTQNFAEGISKILCDFKTAYTTFTGTTYPAAITTLTTAVNTVTVPGVVYAPFSITNTDTQSQVFTKTFTGIGTILSAINPSGGTWSSLSITPPTTITTGFNSLIAYIGTMNTTIAGLQVQIASFDNTGNCLAGGATDTIHSTVAQVITALCAKPSYAAGSITTWGGITTGTTLQNSVQYIVNAINSLFTNGVIGVGTGLTYTTIGSTYQGYKVAVDPTYTTLYKTKLTADSYTAADFLDAKIVGDETTIHIDVGTTNAGKLTVSSLTTGANNKVKVNVNDSTGNYLANKLPGTRDATWGIDILAITAGDNSTLSMTASLNPDLMFSNMMTYISNSPLLFQQFQQLMAQGTGTCAVPTNLTVVLTTGDFVLAWTPSGSAVSQQSKYRITGTPQWLTAPGISPANPETNSASTSTISGSVINTNILYEFAIDSVCVNGGIGTSNVYQMIKYEDDSSFTNTVVSGVIGVNQNPKRLDNIFYRLKNASNTVIQNVTTTGSQPAIQFTSVASGNYHVEWRFGTLVNGVVLYSDDSTQLNAWIASGTIVVP